MTSKTFCEILKNPCDNSLDSLCSQCSHSQNFLNEIAIRHRQKDPKKRVLKFFDTPDSLSLRHQEHHPSIARIAKGAIFDNSNTGGI